MSFQSLQQRQQQLDRLVLNCEIICRSSSDEADEEHLALASPPAAEEETTSAAAAAAATISEVDSQTVHSQKSWWADISEVNSQQTMKSENLSCVDRQQVDDDDGDDDWNPPLPQQQGVIVEATPKTANGILKPSSLMPRRLLAATLPTPTDRKVDSTNTVNDDGGDKKMQQTDYHYHQPSGESACEDDCSSMLSSSVTFDNMHDDHHHKSHTQADLLVKQAQEQVIDAQHELAAVEARLVALQSQHSSQIEQLQNQVAISKVVENELSSRLVSQNGALVEVEGKLATAEQEKADLQHRVAELTERLAEQSQQLTEQAKVHEQKDADYKTKVQSLEDQVKSLQQEKERAERKLQDALESLELLERQIAEHNTTPANAACASPSKSVRIMEEQNVVVEYHDSDYVCRLHQSQEEARVMEERLMHVKETLSGLRDEHDQLKKAHDETCQRHVVELEHERSSKKSSQAQIKSLLEELVRLRETEKQLTADRDALQQQLDDAQRTQAHTHERLKSKEQEASLLELELIRVKDAVQALRQESNRMMAMPTSAPPSPPRYTGGCAHSQYIQPKHDETAQRLRDEADRLADRLVEMQSKMEADVEAANVERQALLDELQVANDRLEVAHRRLAQMEMEKKELHQQLLQLQEIVTQLKKERDELVAEKTVMQEAHSKEVSEQHLLVETSKKHAAKLQLELDDISLANGHLQHQKAELEDYIKDIETKYSKLQQDHADSNNRQSGTMVELEEQRTLLAAANATISALQNERDGLRREVIDLKQSQDVLEAKLHETEEMWRDAVMQVRMKQEELIALRDTLAKTIEDKCVLEDKLSKMKQSPSPSSAIKRIGRVVGRRGPIDSTDMKRTQKEAAKYGEEIIALRRDIEDMEAKCYGLQTDLAASNELVTKLEHDLVTGRCELESDRAANKKLLQSKMDALRTAEDELKTLRCELEESRKEHTRYARGIGLLEQTVADLVSRTTSNDSQLAELQQKLAAAKKAHDELEDELRVTRAKAQLFKEERDQSVLAALSLKTTNDHLTKMADAQSSKIQKLAKFIARTLDKQNSEVADCSNSTEEEMDDSNCPRRVSGMAMHVTFTYSDRISGAPSTMSLMAEYTGPVIDGLAHGPGMLRFDCGDLYLGSFDRGSIIKGVGSFIRRRQDKLSSKSDVQSLMNDSCTKASMICG